MTLLQLDIEQFRSVRHSHLDLAPDVNVIVGKNASGKTSLLEAVYLLGTGHSFRTHQTEILIHQGSQHFQLVAQVARAAGGAEVLGIRGSTDRKEVRINGQPACSFAELATKLPVQVIDPEVHRLLEDGPIRRRRFMDWGVFHVEPRFYDSWRRFQRALRQRNAALKNNLSIAMIRLWDQELLEQGELVAARRDDYVAALKPYVRELGQRLLGLELEIEHRRGWKQQVSFESTLIESFSRDQQRGSTSSGPHRADLILKVSNLSAKDRVSRGQQKMLACALILAQQAHRIAMGASPACLLIDDPAAELDVDNLRKLLAVVAEIPSQLMITSITQDLLTFFPKARLFHVEHGLVQPVA